MNEATGELNDLRTIRDFVKSFRDGKIDLREFERGPDIKGRGPAVDDDEMPAFDEEMDAFLSHLASARRPRGGIDEVIDDILGHFAGARKVKRGRRK